MSFFWNIKRTNRFFETIHANTHGQGKPIRQSQPSQKLGRGLQEKTQISIQRDTHSRVPLGRVLLRIGLLTSVERPEASQSRRRRGAEQGAPRV